MRVLLIQSRSIQPGDDPVYPLGLCYVATALANKGHDINIYDTNTSNNCVPEVKREIHKFMPDIIGVSLRNLDTSFWSQPYHYVQPCGELLSTIKETTPGTKIMVGGPGFSICGRQVMERMPQIDFGILNEGEETATELLDALDQPQTVQGIFLRDNEKLIFTGKRKPLDFTSLPAPRHDFIDIEPYLKFDHSIGIQTKRGCCYKCCYCVYPYLQGTGVRMRSPEAVLDEMQELVQKYNAKSFYFVDSVFNVPQDHAREILEGILARGLKIDWRGFDELKYFDEDYFKLTNATGCNTYEFSPDAISNSTLRRLNKVTTREDIERAYSIVKKNKNIRVVFNFFMNGPGENWDNIFRLTHFTIRCRLTLRKQLSAVRLLFVRIYPNTIIYTLAIRKGLIKPDDDIIKEIFYNPPPFCYLLNILIPIGKIGRFFFRGFKRLLGLIPGVSRKSL